MQAGTRAVKEIMEKIERVRQKDGERGSWRGTAEDGGSSDEE